MSKAGNIDECACAPCCSFRQTGQIDRNCSDDVCRADWMVRGLDGDRSMEEETQTGERGYAGNATVQGS